LSQRYVPNVAGGGEISLRVLSEALVCAGHRVTVLCFDGDREEDIGGVRVIRKGPLPAVASPRQCLWAMGAAARLARSHDLVQLQNLFHLHYGGVRLPRGPVPVMAGLNDVPGLRPARRRTLASRSWARLRNHLYVWAARRIRWFTAVSESLKEAYVRCGFPRERISVFPVIVDPAYLRPVVAAEDRGGFRPIYIGRLAEHKGVDRLLRAFAAVAADDSTSVLDIVGDGPARPALEALSHALGVGERVRFGGEVPNAEIPSLLDACDVVVHPGRWSEPFGRVVLEAMARGRPSIVTDRGQPQRSVADPRLVFRPEERGALADRIRWLRDHPRVRREMGVELRRRAEAFSATRLLPRLEAIYADVLRRS
jgi:glycosyltransferase involved in cell wall biosynthesis